MRSDLTLFALLATSMASCGGGTREQVDTTSAAAPAVGSSAAGAVAGTATAASTPALVALGDSIFHGQSGGGICYTCHGPDAKGTQLAPNLTDREWLNGDGSLPFIQKTVTNGVPAPKKYPGAMPAFGQTLTPEQIRAVAAYVYSFSHPAS